MKKQEKPPAGPTAMSWAACTLEANLSGSTWKPSTSDNIDPEGESAEKAIEAAIAQGSCISFSPPLPVSSNPVSGQL